MTLSPYSKCPVPNSHHVFAKSSKNASYNCTNLHSSVLQHPIRKPSWYAWYAWSTLAFFFTAVNFFIPWQIFYCPQNLSHFMDSEYLKFWFANILYYSRKPPAMEYLVHCCFLPFSHVHAFPFSCPPVPCCPYISWFWSPFCWTCYQWRDLKNQVWLQY